MRLAFHCFYFKSRWFLLVYLGAISGSYTIFFYLDASQETTTKLATVCKNNQTPCFLDLRAFAGFWVRFADFWRDFCGAFWSVCFFVFCWGGVAESDPHTQSQCTTVQPQEMLLTSAGDGKNMLKHSCFFPISMVFGRFSFWWRSQKN